MVKGVSDCATCDEEGAKSNYELTFKVDVTLARGVAVNADVTSVSKLPGTSNFIGELCLFSGIAQDNIFVTFFGAFGIFLSGVYYLWTFQKSIVHS